MSSPIHLLLSLSLLYVARKCAQVWFQNRRMKDKRQRLQSLVWPYNMAAAAAAAVAAAADQSGLYAYVMQSTAAASLLHAQYPYTRHLPPTPLSLQSPSNPGSSVVALAAALRSASAVATSSPLSYLAPSRPVPLPTGSGSDRVSQFPATWKSLDYDAVYGSLVSLGAARQRAAVAAGSAARETTSTASCPSVSDAGVMSTSLFRPYESLSVGVASD